MTIYRLCNTCGGTYPMAGRSTGKCPDCQRTYERNKSQRRRANSTATRTRNTAAWQKTRDLARARDGGCVYRDRGDCNGQLQVHHVIPLERGGTNNLDNLITCCRAHHEQVEPRFFRDAPSHPPDRFSRKKLGEVPSNLEDLGEGPSVG